MLKNVIIGALAVALTVSLVLRWSVPGPPAEPRSPIVTDTPVEVIQVPAVPEPIKEPEPDARLVAFDAVIDAAKSDPGMAGAAIGFCLIDPSGKTIYEHRADVAQIPASSLKTLTTATALEVLGPDFRFKTRLGVSVPLKDSGTEGDLILVGGGDPMLAIKDFQTWVEGLVKAGLLTIPGRVIGDGRLFPGSPFADFWNWGDIGNGYGSPVAGLNLEHNRFTAVLKPGEKEGEPTSLGEIFPGVPGVEWLNQSITGSEGSGDGIVIHGGERASVMHLRGTVPPGGEMIVTGAVPDPEKFAAFHLREALLAAGIKVGGEAVGAGDLLLKNLPVPVIGEELLVHQSPPLLDIITSIHATSDNHETECVFRTLGLETGLPPDEAIRKHWEQRGIDLSGLRMVDGSGLARADFITPRALAHLQYLVSTGPRGKEYVESLLVALDGALRFKAGAMSAVRSYTGLLDTASGQRLSFALIVNHYADSSAVQTLQRGLFEAMAAW
ncbi:MAG: D-alanyl-D-alanine carboxypeptidase/D-alanyl-D-alanine-endopeptidase [Verrucomicrobiales bacterium]|nr:D-alanyl-D-alanine carboxypeptidase/D-alanyl-D-alanine-endopeptidase [Verrucomicrobiales bacterium]